MSVLAKYFKKSSYQTPVQVDFDRKVNYDEEGNEIISFYKTDYPAIVSSLGSSLDWSLTRLLLAGIDPQMSIHTTFGTRIEGFGSLNSAIDSINSVFDSENKSE